MTSVFTRWLPCFTLAVWAIVLLHFAKLPGAVGKGLGALPLFTGRVDDFLIPRFHWMVLAAGIVLLGMALVFLFSPAVAACCETDDCGHPLSRFQGGKWLTFLILIVPIVVAARFSPDGFSANAVRNRGEVTDANTLAAMREARKGLTPPDLTLPSKSAPAAPAAPAAVPAPVDSQGLKLPTAEAPAATAAAPTPAAPATPGAAPAAAAPAENGMNEYLRKTPEGFIVAEVLDLLYAAQDNTLRAEFENKKVELIGQLMPDAAAPAGTKRFKAVRMFMTCCAADARPVSITVAAPELPTLPEMTWVRIIGTATFPLEKGRRAAILQAESVTKSEPPPDSMLY